MFSTDFLAKLENRRCMNFLCFLMIAMFNISTLSAQTPGSALACNNNVQVSLDFDCEADITPGMVLEGEDEEDLDQFSVSIEGLSGTVVSVPGVYIVTVTEIASGNSCWGTITVEDKLAPVVDDCNCPPGNTDPDCEFLCTDLDGILAGTVATPQPVVSENCSGLTSVFSDAVTDGAGCGQTIITRTWSFTDAAGNVGDGCVQEFRLQPVSLGDVTQPPAVLEVPCGTATDQASLLSFLGNGAVAQVYPTVNGTPIIDGICNLVATNTDLEVPVCDLACSNSLKVIREFTVLDWCAGTSIQFTQVVKAVDNVPPVVEAEDITVSTDPWQCVGNFFLPAPTTLFDACTDFVTYTVSGPAGTIVQFNNANGLYLATGAPKGVNTFTYTATDCCGNTSSDDIQVSVLDQAAPVAVTKEFVVVTLTTGGQAKVFTESIDNGSHDGCTEVKLEIRRDSDNCSVVGNSTYNNDGHPQDSNNDPDDGAFVKFCCADANALENDVNGDGTLDRGYVKVWLRVFDDGDMDGVFGSSGDNYNEAWTYVKVEDKLAPTIICPITANILCTDDIDDLDLTGTAVASAICDDIQVDYTDADNTDECGVGFVNRRWFVVGSPQINCTQRINIRGDYYDGPINFPADYTSNCIDIGDDGQVPTWGGNVGCSRLGYTLESDTFVVEQDACLKIFNRWTVIDWCRYNPNTSTPEGIWSDVQIIKVVDDVPPTINCSDEMLAVTDGCELDNPTFSATAMDNGDCPSPWLKWRIFVDLFGDGTVDYEFSTFLPVNDNSFNDTNDNGIPDRYIAPTSSGEEVEIRLPISVPGSMSNHKIEYKAFDGCGNGATCLSNVMIVDKKAPTPYCQGISSALMVNGMVELWACDFDLGSFDNCTAQSDLRFTFDDVRPSQDPTFNPALNCSARTFTCDDIADGNDIEVQVYVWDEKNERDFCTVVLSLIDNQGACGDLDNRVSIAGRVVDPIGGTMTGVNISLEDLNDGPAITVQSEEDGGYIFNNIPNTTDYKVYGDYDIDYRKGINTLDIVLIQRHILGLEQFEDVYQTIASDITNDEKVTAADLLSLRKLILGISDDFNNQKSYLILDPTKSYEDVTDPWPLDDQLDLVNITNNITGQDLVVVKVGDVNRDGFENAKGDNEIEGRSEVNMRLEAVAQGNLTSIKTAHQVNVSGLQMTIDLQGGQLTDILSGTMNISDDMYYVNAGKLYISWASAEMREYANDSQLFSIVTSVPTSISLDKAGKLTNEAYVGEELKTVGLEINIRTHVDTEYSFALGQNEPNPFKQITTFTYELPTADAVQISIYDLSGKQIKSESVAGVKGMNSYKVNMEASATGVYYYTISTSNFSATKKMILID